MPENLLKDSYITIQNHNKLYKENEKIKSELEILKAKDLLNEFIISENQHEIFSQGFESIFEKKHKVELQMQMCCIISFISPYIFECI